MYSTSPGMCKWAAPVFAALHKSVSAHGSAGSVGCEVSNALYVIGEFALTQPVSNEGVESMLSGTTLTPGVHWV